MTDHAEEDRELLRDMSDRATTLYWNSDRSVNSIADDLGLSKGRLYDLIRPLGSGRHCANCQSERIFANRTAHERDDAICPICDADGPQTPLVPEPSLPSMSSGRSDSPRSDEAPPPAPSPDTRGVLTGFLVGTVAGIVLGRYFRH